MSDSFLSHIGRVASHGYLPTTGTSS
jgi:guanine nucleotide-binding protein alpha-1 subunit